MGMRVSVAVGGRAFVELGGETLKNGRRTGIADLWAFYG
jgi:hypothetical protein